MADSTVKKKRMPKLTIDEVLLLVDTYFQLKEIKTSAIRKDMIQELSDNMRKLPFYPELTSDSTFRSVAGMDMCLANVSYLDPENSNRFGHGSALQRRVYEYYLYQKANLRKLAIAINSVAMEKFPILSEYTDFIGGSLLPSYHHFLETTDKTAKKLKKDAESNKRSICYICGEDLSYKYGEDAPLIMDVHLRTPLSSLRNGTSCALSDLILLCPCCHKKAHLKPENFTLEHIK